MDVALDTKDPNTLSLFGQGAKKAMFFLGEDIYASTKSNKEINVINKNNNS